MKIIISTNLATATDLEKGEDATMGLNRVQMQLEKDSPEEEVPLEMVVFSVGQAFQFYAEFFLEHHSCKDCSTYRIINSMYQHMVKAQRDSLKANGGEGLLEKLDNQG